MEHVSESATGEKRGYIISGFVNNNISRQQKALLRGRNAKGQTTHGLRTESVDGVGQNQQRVGLSLPEGRLIAKCETISSCRSNLF